MATTATATRVGAVDVDAPVAHGLAALALKLQHPLVRIRARALANLLFKLRERLVDVAAEPRATVDALMKALVASLAESKLEPTALQVLQLVLLDADEQAARACAAALRRHGAAIAFQRGGLVHGHASTDSQTIYEALLHRLLATSSAVHEEPAPPPPPTMATTDGRHGGAALPSAPPSLASSFASLNGNAAATFVPRTTTASALVAADKQTAPLGPLASHGWRFPRVALAAVDEQFLFEVEVKWRLRSSVPEIVEMCDTFRRDLLRDFPPEVFLQRPAMLLRVLELVRQPIVPAATTPELSFGVNYFDEPASRASFVWKPSVLATALHISTLKALESWLAAMRHARGVSLNPMYHTFQSSAEAPSSALMIPMTGFDHRRLYYPRVAEAEDHVSLEEAGLSLGGAAYMILETLLRLLSSEIYPHLHVLNVIHAVTELLPERGVSPRGGGANPIDKARLEALFAILADVVRVEENDRDPFVNGRLVEWFTKILALIQPSMFRVEGGSSDENGGTSGVIVVPSALWTWTLQRLALSDSGKGNHATMMLLDQIDSSASSTISQLVRSNEDRVLLSAVLHKDSHLATLAQAKQILQVVPSMSEYQRSGAVRLVLQAISRALSAKGDDDPSTDEINDVMVGTVSLGVHESSPRVDDFVSSFYGGLTDWIQEDPLPPNPGSRLKNVVRAISASATFMHILLCRLASNEAGESKASEALWRFADVILRGFEDVSDSLDTSGMLHALSKSLPILQHLAYFDSSQPSVTDAQRRLQRTLMNVARETEAALTAQDQLLAVARCLVHRTAFIRRAAASGLLDRLETLGIVGLHREDGGSVVYVDPFGQFADGTGENPRRALEQEFPSILQARASIEAVPRAERPNSIGTSVILHRISRLRKLLSSLFNTSDDQEAMQSAVKSTLQQLLIDLAHASSTDFTILEEAGEVEELVHATFRLLPQDGKVEPQWLSSLCSSSLSIVRLVMMRSKVWRQRIREDAQALGLLLSFVFAEDARVRAETYFIVLSLTCSLETPRSESDSGLVVPSEFCATFGLFSERWSAIGISVQPCINAVNKSSSSSNNRLSFSFNEAVSDKETYDQAFQRLWDGLLDATSFRTYLDALYAVTQACYASHNVRVTICTRWGEASFRRYLETTPTSSKDQVIVGAILALVTVLFDTMAKDLQMDIILLLRRKVIPLLLSRDNTPPRATSLEAEIARLLFRISRSDECDMLVPLLIDTGLVKNIGALVVASGVSIGPTLSQRSMWIQVILSALEKTKLHSDHVSTRRQILEAVRLPLSALAGRHYVPGSFQERDVYVYAISCLTLSDDDDSPWRARLLFETSANLRSTGFQVATLMLSTNEHDTIGRILRLAADTMRETSESDAVRSSAALLLLDFCQRVEREAVTTYRAYVDWERFVPDIIRDLISSSQTASKCSVRLNLSRVQLLRFFISQPERFAGTPCATVLANIVSSARDDSRALLAFLELLSLRRAFELYQRHNVEFLHMQSTEDAVWLRSILPVVLNTALETSKLLLTVAQHSSSSGTAILEAIPFESQLAETISDLAGLMESSSMIDSSGSRLYYETLDQCGKLLAFVLSSTATKSLQSDAANRLLQGIVKLLNPAHPRLFRVSFARVIPVILCLRSGELFKQAIATQSAVPIGQSLWNLYIELCDIQPLDPAVVHRRTSSFLQNLRRVACSLHALVSQSEAASSSLCGQQHGAVRRVIDVIRNSFAAIRRSGGFGAKSTKRSDEGFAVEMCEAIQLHCQVLGGFFVQSRRAQHLAREEQLPSVFANHWNMMRMAYSKGSGVLISALRLLQNFIHASDENKTSLATTTAVNRASPSGGGDGERNLLMMVGELTLGSSTSTSFDERWRSIAASILKSAFLHVDCLHSAIKSGLIGKLFSSVVERCKRQRQTVKTSSTREEQTLVELVGVLASVASSDEGRQMVLQIRGLKDLLDDIFHFPECSKLSTVGALFVRNMAFSKFSKSYFSVWEPVLDKLLVQLYRLGDDRNPGHDDKLRLVNADHYSTALLCFVHDNQRAQSVIQSSQNAMLLLRDATRVWSSGVDDKSFHMEGLRRVRTVASNLERVFDLLADQGARIE